MNTQDEQDAPQFDALLDYLKRTRGFDFNAYKRGSLMRRIGKRVQAVNLGGFGEYVDYLEVHPDEFAQLFNVVLINVTSFFRDDSAWEFVREQLVPALVDGRPAAEPIRVWTAACASGEETYSVAMLLADALGRDGFRERVKIYATDIDEQALSQARQASYTDKQIAPVPAEYVDRYFAREGDRFVFDKDLRRSVIFGRHDLIQDAPISRVNLLICRNALMYFHNEAQARILARFHFALNEGGFLFLGKAEMLLTHAQMFAPVDLRRRVFRKVQKTGWRERLAIMTQANGEEAYGRVANHHDLFPAAFDAHPSPTLLVDTAGALVFCNESARAQFNLVPADLGRPLQDLEVSYRPADLRSLIEQAYEQRRPASLRGVELQAGTREPRCFDVAVTPLLDGAGNNVGASVTFVDVTHVKDLEAQLARSRQDLETAYEELQSTNEELETTNEELQSTVEELETTNEELQSTNEELETMNEELQSTNEELHTINEELRERSDQLNRANSFLESVLTGVRSGVIVVDRGLHVLAWNHRSEDLWGLRADEVRGQNILNLDIGLPIEQIRPGIRACLAGDLEFWDVALHATNRRGRAIQCKVTCSPLVTPVREVGGVIVLVDEETVSSAVM